MENNENLNNQVEQDNNTNIEEANNTQIDSSNNTNQIVNQDNNTNPKKSNGTKFIIIILVLIILGLGGYIAYTNLIQKNDVPSNGQEKSNTNPTPTNEEKQKLNLIAFNDEKSIAKEKEILSQKGEEYKEEKFDYYGEFNNKLIKLHKSDDSNDIFNFYYGNAVGDSQNNTYYFFVNNQNNELYDLEYEKDDKPIMYYCWKYGNKYYIAKYAEHKNTISPEDAIAIYDTDLNIVADTIIDSGNGDIIYGLKDGYLIKIDYNGKIVKKGATKIAKDSYSDIYTFNDNIYIVIKDGSFIYLYDLDNNKKIQLTDTKDYKFCYKNDENCSSWYINYLYGNELIITIPASDSSKVKDAVFVYNTKNQQLEKKEIINPDGITYKTEDGKNTLKISLKKSQKSGDSFNDYLEYDGYYNNKHFLVKANNLISKYEVLGAVKDGQEGSQCGFSHEFVINTSNNTLVNFDYSGDYGSYYQIHKVSDKYYFSKGGCALGFLADDVYDEQLNKLGDLFYGGDDNNNVYVLNDGKITKYNSNSEVIKTSSNKYDSSNLGYSVAITNESIYMTLLENKMVFLLNGMTGEKYVLGSNIEFSSFSEFPGVILTEKDGNIIIDSFYIDDEETIYNPIMTFNTKTKTLTK